LIIPMIRRVPGADIAGDAVRPMAAVSPAQTSPVMP
jgi:hypothetical protein